MKIGFFDSGLGGIIILKAVTKLLPQYDYEFYGDTANLPYGDKSEEQVRELTRVGINHLFAKDCLLVIVACNTASAETLRYLQETLLQGKYSDRRILGVIIPTVEEVIKNGDQKVSILATKRTIDSKKYKKEFAKFVRPPRLESHAETNLVTLLEANKMEEAKAIIKSHIEKAILHKCTSLILGCTHFSLLKDYAKMQSHCKLKIIAQDEIIPDKLKEYLERHPEIHEKLSLEGKRNIYLTNKESNYTELLANMVGGVFLAEK